MFKKFAVAVMAAAMVAGSAMTAFASNLTGPFFYFNAGLTTQAPSHAQQCVSKVVTSDNGDGTTNIVVHVVTVENDGVVGEITQMTVAGVSVPADNDMIIFEKVSNALIADNGALNVGVTLSYGGHETDLASLYLNVGTED